MKYILCCCILIWSLEGFAQNSNCNCCSSSHSEFDFWVGEWNVTNPDGTLAGTNRIEKIQGNCVLQENWTSAKGKFTGTSNNYYNSKTKQWEQIWLDNSVGSLHLKGTRIGNQMILQSDPQLDQNQNSLVNRITWTQNPDGTVRQLWEVLTNSQEVTVVFDGLYKKN